jgi:hypothetical protein
LAYLPPSRMGRLYRPGYALFERPRSAYAAFFPFERAGNAAMRDVSSSTVIT